ncbi:MAG: omptin family outer membrane protease [Kiritimatiellae bacterium]|nr:omptin family outer membrane protease [Kiritimatiellia bacterium]
MSKYMMSVESSLRLVVALAAVVFAGLFNPSTAPALQATEGPNAAAVTTGVFSASVRLSGGWLNGQAREIVYEQVDGARYKLSELQWDMKNLVMAGGVASVRILDLLSINAGFWGAGNKGNGQMDDTDWLLHQHDSTWTDWSLSDVDVTRAYIFDLNAAVECLRFEHMALRAMVGYKENRWAWEDSASRHIYSTAPATPGGFRDDVGEDNGENGINYEQTIRIPYVGLGAALAIQRLDFDLYFNYSPLVQAKDEDHHVLRDVWFEETFKNGNYFGAGLRATYTFPCRVFFSGRFDYQVIPEIIGDTEIWDATGTSSSTDSAGLENECWMLSLEGGYSF